MHEILNMTRAGWRRDAERRLQQHLGPALSALGQTPDFRLDAEILLQHVLGCSRSSLYAWPEGTIEPHQIHTLDTLLKRRALGEPLAYLIGHAEFRAREFLIRPGVLVPRDDTETLVNVALELLTDRTGPADRAMPHGQQPVIVDVGTGSGAIAVTVAAEHGVRVIATDVSATALELASENVARHAPERVTLIQADWLSAFAHSSAHMIVSNPPYIAEHDAHLLQLSCEPELALVSGTRGLDAIEQIINEAVRVGVPGCPVILEHGHKQGPAVQALMKQACLAGIRTELDLAGHERVTLGHVAY